MVEVAEVACSERCMLIEWSEGWKAVEASSLEVVESSNRCRGEVPRGKWPSPCMGGVQAGSLMHLQARLLAHSPPDDAALARGAGRTYRGAWTVLHAHPLANLRCG